MKLARSHRGESLWWVLFRCCGALLCCPRPDCGVAMSSRGPTKCCPLRNTCVEADAASLDIYAAVLGCQGRRREGRQRGLVKGAFLTNLVSMPLLATPSVSSGLDSQGARSRHMAIVCVGVMCLCLCMCIHLTWGVELVRLRRRLDDGTWLKFLFRPTRV